MRSRMILPRFVYLKKKKTARTSTAMPAEPKADNTPINIPRPVEPASLMFMKIDAGMPSLPCESDCSQLPASGNVDVGTAEGGGVGCDVVAIKVGTGST